MDIQLAKETIKPISFKNRFYAKIAVLLSFPLIFLSPQSIEKMLNFLGKNKKIATYEQVALARNSVCLVSKKCRNQDRCIKRSLATFIMIVLQGKKCSWCTGYAMDPFRAHAWVEVGNMPVGEIDEIKKYEITIKTEDFKIDDKDEIDEGVLKAKKSNEIITDKSRNGRLRDLFNLISDRKKELISIMILGVLSSILTLIQPNLVSKIIANGDFDFVRNFELHMLIVIIIASTLLTTFQYYILQKISEQAIYKARKGLIRNILRLPIASYSNWSSGDLLSRISSDTSKLRVGIVQLSVSITSGVFLVIGAVVGLMIKDFSLFLITLISILISFIFITFMSGLIQKSSYSAQKSLGVLTSIINRDLLGIRTIRSTNETENEIKKAVNETDKIKFLGLKLAKFQSIMTPMSNLGLQLCGLIVIGIGGYKVANGTMSIADLTSFILLLYIAISPIQQIFAAMSSVADSLGAMGRIKEIMELPLENQYDIIKQRINRDELDEKIITFNNVTFSYDKYVLGEAEDDKDIEPILKDICFSVNKGECVSIVGPSGAGKSTILQLMERFYELKQGNIYLNGINYQSISREEIRSKIAYVEQNAPLIYGTIYENLKLGNADVDRADCEYALKRVNLEYLLNRSKLGLDTIVGENGIGFSGGERQRLAMARALLSNAEIVLLDELTSNLDSINEKILKGVINELRGKKTIIIVAHRLSTVIDSDVIYVLEHGRIVGKGTHNELLATIPLYRELAKEQMVI
ncbi:MULTISPECIES: lasso peptide biosynthesis B2 protein [Bacillota]|uniref:lasso peptide biosynthesis B2 protein n=1 Tax=Bacillota TaxID=1239 RepID=UPI0023F4F24A|nr:MULTISPECIES: lasso peptide biosynthesis B2 protein [Bacillota]MDD7184037.1 lasso peptide biosynthesis B2 protein [Peptostreptococcus porci]MDY3050941.1 lasso peptide biosynthesis B2 protein [Parvimonas sp.]